MVFRACFFSFLLISGFGCLTPPNDPSPSNGGNSDGSSEGSAAMDAGSSDDKMTLVYDTTKDSNLIVTLPLGGEVDVTVNCV